MGCIETNCGVRDLTHSADPEEIDHLEAYLNKQIPPLDEEKNTSL